MPHTKGHSSKNVAPKDVVAEPAYEIVLQFRGRFLLDLKTGVVETGPGDTAVWLQPEGQRNGDQSGQDIGQGIIDDLLNGLKGAVDRVQIQREQQTHVCGQEGDQDQQRQEEIQNIPTPEGDLQFKQLPFPTLSHIHTATNCGSRAILRAIGQKEGGHAVAQPDQSGGNDNDSGPEQHQNDEQERKIITRHYPFVEFCDLAELSARVELERNRFDGTGYGDPPGCRRRRGVSEL